MRLDAASIFEAAKRIRGWIARTPLTRAGFAAGQDGELFLKLECVQETGSFKLRGAANFLLASPSDRRARGVITASTGNHGRAVAWMARALGIPASVCVAAGTPGGKLEAIRRLGAVVQPSGRSQDEAEHHAKLCAEREGLLFVPSFDDPLIIAGQGTVALEIFEDRPDVDTIVVPLSGGGLAAGVALLAKALRPGVRVVGVSMKQGAAMAASLEAGRPLPVEEGPTLADALRGGIGLDNRWTFALCRDLLDAVVLVEEEAIAEAMRRLFLEERLVVEGAGAVPVAALLSDALALPAAGRSVLLLSGRNVDPAMLLGLLRR